LLNLFDLKFNFTKKLKEEFKCFRLKKTEGVLLLPN